MIRITNKQEKQCRVGSGTGNPCLRPAVVEVSGVLFCEACAREQEAYFAIGELTEKASQLNDEESLVEMLEWTRQIKRRRHLTGSHKPEAAWFITRTLALRPTLYAQSRFERL